MIFRKKISLKSCCLKLIFFFKIVLSKSARNTQKLRILRGKLAQNVIFCVQSFFQSRAFQKYFFLQNRALQKFIFLQNHAFKNLFFFKM